MELVTSDWLTQKRAASEWSRSTARRHPKKACWARLIPTRGPRSITRTANRAASRNNLSISRLAMPDKKLSNKLDLFRSNRSEPDWHLAALVRSIKARRENAPAGFPPLTEF